jgi:hypothetical protein
MYCPTGIGHSQFWSACRMARLFTEVSYIVYCEPA